MEYTLDNSKQELIAEIDRRIDDKIIEKSNADLRQHRTMPPIIFRKLS